MSFFYGSRRRSIRSVSYLLVAFLILGGLALQSHMEAVTLRRYLANSRRHAFSELASGLNELDATLQKGVYATSPAMMSALCTQIFGRAMSAQMALGELPYSDLELEQTATFLAKTGDYAAALSRSTVATGTCTEEQRNTLRGLSEAASTLSAQVSALQFDLTEGASNLEDVTTVQDRLATKESGDVVAGSVYQNIEKEFPEIPSLIYDGPFSDHITERAPRMLEGLPDVTQEEARQAAARFMDLKPDIFSLISAGEGKLPTYGFSASVDGGELYVEVTRQGGLVVEVFNSRTPGSPTITRDEAIQSAEQFLSSRGYPNMKESYYIDQSGVLTINFAATQNGVACYPDLVKISIALDTGRIMNFESQGYLMNHTVREFPQGILSVEEAQQVVSSDLEILSHALAVVPTGGEYEVLCHEFKCQSSSGEHVLVYVNAQTGIEEKILILLEDESGTLAI